MSFFEPPPAPPAPQRPRPLPWIGPPDNVLGAVVPLNVLLARTDDVAITVAGGFAYPTGVELTVSARSRRAEHDWMDSFQPRFARRKPGLPPELLRFGIEFADGRRATNLGWPWSGRPDDEPERPVLAQHGGGGSGRHFRQEFWLWPLPPPGPLAFVCEWPAYGIPETRREIEASVILDTAAQAEMLWPDEPGGDDYGFSETTLVGTD
jgi:hypothetical protein